MDDYSKWVRNGRPVSRDRGLGDALSLSARQPLFSLLPLFISPTRGRLSLAQIPPFPLFPPSTTPFQ